MTMGGMAPTMGLSNRPGPVEMPHVRRDPQTSFSPQSSFNQGFMGTPDWSATSLVMSNAPGPYTNTHSFDLDMWVSDAAPEPQPLPTPVASFTYFSKIPCNLWHVHTLPVC